MTKTAYIVDSTGSISDELRNRSDVFEVKLSIAMHDSIFYDTSNREELAKFYQKLEHLDYIPSTSQPEAGEMVKVFQQIISEGYQQAIVITMPQALSGTNTTLRLIAQEFEEQLQTLVIDSLLISFQIERMLIHAIELIDRGADLNIVASKLAWYSQHGSIYCMIPELDYIVKGGRLSKGAAMMGSMLQIRPIIYFKDDGSVEIYSKPRTTKRAYQTFMQIIDQGVHDYGDQFVAGVAHAHNLVDAQMLCDKIQQKYPTIAIRSGYLTPVLGVYAGPGALGIGIMPNISYDF